MGLACDPSPPPKKIGALTNLRGRTEDPRRVCVNPRAGENLVLLPTRRLREASLCGGPRVVRCDDLGECLLSSAAQFWGRAPAHARAPIPICAPGVRRHLVRPHLGLGRISASHPSPPCCWSGSMRCPQTLSMCQARRPKLVEIARIIADVARTCSRSPQSQPKLPTLFEIAAKLTEVADDVRNRHKAGRSCPDLSESSSSCPDWHNPSKI